MSSRPEKLSSFLVGVALTAIKGSLAAAAAGALSWSGLQPVDVRPPFGTHPAIVAVSCPTDAFCVAVDDRGEVISSTHPQTGARGWTHARYIDPGSPLAGIACPSTNLCVAVDKAGNVLTSRTPARPSAPWKRFRVGAFHGLGGVSCPSASFCVAFDDGGDVLVSEHPAAGRMFWKRNRIFARTVSDELVSVSCPSRSLCVGLDAFGDDVLSSTQPTRAGPWKDVRIGPSGSVQPGGISCASPRLCVISGNSHDPAAGSYAMTSTDPTGGARRWKLAANISIGRLANVSCPSTSLCLIGGSLDRGPTIYSRHPAGGRHTWKVAYRPALSTTGVSCGSVSLCVAFDLYGNVTVSSDPTGGYKRWKLEQVEGSNDLTASSCTSQTFCLLGDSEGRVLVSRNPAAATPHWRRTPISAYPGVAILSISCASPALCGAGESTELITASRNPAGGAASWHAAEIAPIADTDAVTGISCPSVSLCVATDYSQSLHGGAPRAYSAFDTSTNPTGGDSAWARSFYDNGFYDPTAVTAMSCPTQTLCVAVDTGGNVVTSTKPTSDSWTRVRRDRYSALTSVSCPNESLCVAVDSAGYLITSTYPAAGGWKIARIDGSKVLSGVSCPSTALCAAVDQAGNVLTSTNPTGGTSAWRRAAHVDDELLSITCTREPFCIATGANGDTVTGTNG